MAICAQNAGAAVYAPQEAAVWTAEAGVQLSVSLSEAAVLLMQPLHLRTLHIAQVRLTAAQCLFCSTAATTAGAFLATLSSLSLCSLERDRARL